MARSFVPPRLRLWPSLSPGVYLRRPSEPLPFPLGEPGAALYSRARHGLWHGVRILGLEEGDEVLVPAYHCGQEVEALAQAGLVCRFYEAADSLEPDAAELDSLVGERTRGLFVIHYYGFPQDVRRWRSWCDERGLLLLEDCAHTFLGSLDGRPLGSFGDLAIFSFAKTLPVPDGGALLAAGARARETDGLAVTGVAKRHARWLMSRSGGAHRLLARFERERVETFELGNPDSHLSSSTLFLLRRLAEPAVAAARRANYARLLDEFPDSSPPAFARLPDGASPLIFPLDPSTRPGVLDRLARAGISSEPFWPKLHPLLPAERFPGAVAWHQRFVALPVHQDLRPEDVERIASALR